MKAKQKKNKPKDKRSKISFLSVLVNAEDTMALQVGNIDIEIVENVKSYMTD